MCESKIIVQLISAEVHRLRVYECEISDLTPVSLRNSQQPLKGLTGKARDCSMDTPNSTPVTPKRGRPSPFTPVEYGLQMAFSLLKCVRLYGTTGVSP